MRKKKSIVLLTTALSVLFVFCRMDAFVLSGDEKGAIRTWDISTGKEVGALKSHVSSAYAVAASSDGRYLLTGSFEGQLKFWDATRGILLRTIDAHRGGMTSVGLTPDLQQAFSAGYDRTVKLWNLRDGKLYRTFSGRFGRSFQSRCFSGWFISAEFLLERSRH